MKPSIPDSEKKRTKGRSHPFFHSRELKSSTHSYIESLSAEEERMYSPRNNSSFVAPQSDIIMVSRHTFNNPVSNRPEVQSLEETVHIRLKHAYEDEISLKIGKQERHMVQIQILDNAMKDLCGLINKNCKDQAKFVWKLWSSAADLYQEVFKQLMEEIDSNKRQLMAKSLHIEELERKLTIMSKQQGLYSGTSGSNNVDELTIIRQLEEELNAKDAEFLRVQETMTNLSLWFPHFAKFGSSVLGRFLPPFDEAEEMAMFGSSNPESSDIQDDLKSLKNHFYLAQEYLLYDLKRLEKLGIGLDISHSKPIQPHSRGNNLQGYRSKKEVEISNKLSIAINQPEELQALSYGLFGGPQSSLSFSSARENEYNLRHVSLKASTSSDIAPVDININTVDIDAAVERVVAAVTKSYAATAVQSHANAPARTSPEGDFDIRQFNTLQYRRASNLSMKDLVEDGNTVPDVVDLTKFVKKEDFDMLSYTQHRAMVTIQELERKLKREQQEAADRIDRLENDLKMTQNRERLLKEQLKECQSEADGLLVCLPATCSLPPVCSRTDMTRLLDRKRVTTNSLSTFTLQEVLERTQDMLRHYTCIRGNNFSTSTQWHHNHLDNALNGHTYHWLQMEPRRTEVTGIESFRSVSLGILAPSYIMARWKSSQQVNNEMNALSSSVLSLIMEEIMRSYRENHLQVHFVSSSLSPWEVVEHMEPGETASLASEHLIFLSKMLGYRVIVEESDPDHDLAMGAQSVLVVGMAEASVASHIIDQPYDPLYAKPSPPAVYLEEIPLKDQRIFFDTVVHCHEAMKSCGTRGNFFVPMREISKVIRKVFCVPDLVIDATPFDVARSLLDEHGLHMRPWWRYITPSIEKRLQEECLRMAMDAEHAAYPASDDEDMTWFHPSAQEGLSFTRFCMNSYYAVMEFERCLRRALQDAYIFLISLAPDGPSSPLFFVVLEKLLLISPSKHETMSKNASHQKHTDEEIKTSALPLPCVEELLLLDSTDDLNPTTFADAVLRCAPSKLVERLSVMLSLQDYKNSEKLLPKRKHGLEDIARAGLNLNLYQEASGAFDFSSDNVLGPRSAPIKQEDPASVEYSRLVRYGNVLLRMTEKLMNVGDEDKVSVRNLNQKNSSKKAIPPLASSVFLRSAQYRRLLYGGNPAKDDERDNDSETSSQTGDINYIDFATRILYHLRLCFDPEFVSISDASVAHKWLIIATVETLFHPSDISVLNQSSEDNTQLKNDTEIALYLKSKKWSTNIDSLQLDVYVSQKRATSHKNVGQLASSFRSWRRYSKRQNAKKS